jgi:hypothetical protein
MTARAGGVHADHLATVTFSVTKEHAIALLSAHRRKTVLKVATNNFFLSYLKHFIFWTQTSQVSCDVKNVSSENGCLFSLYGFLIIDNLFNIHNCYTGAIGQVS